MWPEKKRERICVDGEWYILCSSVPLITRKLAIKGNTAFLVVDSFGDIPSAYPSELGYYWRDTRFLSCLEMYVNGAKPVLLSSGIDHTTSVVRVEMTNTDFKVGDRVVQRTSAYIGKWIAFEGDELVYRVIFRNLSLYTLPFDVAFRLEADFRDMFEVRGVERDRRGRLTLVETGEHILVFSYVGLDGVKRRCTCSFSPELSPSDTGANCSLVLSPGEKVSLELRVSVSEERDGKVTAVGAPSKPSFRSSIHFRTDAPLLSQVLARALGDVEMMLSEIEGFAVPMAGVPWYCALFGRDALITAYSLLPWAPEVAADTLKLLAKYQSDSFDDFTDSEPGKILHELRTGEMANMRELPFVPYYGSADATILFVILAAEYLRCTGDLALVRELWENILAAAKWMQVYGDANGDGYVEYKSRSPLGLRNQGWKDSHDSIHHRDGTLAEPPIAVVEVQGYKFRAMQDMAYLCRRMGIDREALRFERGARKLARAIGRDFWMEDRGFYALALDREGRACRVVTSNAGHLLFAGAVPTVRAKKVVARLMDSSMFTGYGIRTLSSDEVRYNPMSYHNGSVWPHDNAIICEGLVRYGFKREALRLFKGLLDAVSHFDHYRVPELFCGFQRQEGRGPVPYPVACSPQAWSSASMLLMLKSILGLRVDAENRVVVFDNPLLPEEVGELVLEDWSTPYFGPFSFRFKGYRGRPSVETLKKPAGWKVVAVVG